MKKWLLNLYAKLRVKLNPIRLEKDNPEWDKYMSSSISEFSSKINKFPYKSDKLGGLIDRTESFSHFIDPNVKSDRDCDDFARMWTMWGICNGYRATEVIVTSKKHFFKDSHVVTILYKNGRHILCNYKVYASKNSLVEALDYLKSWGTSYVDGYIYAISIIENQVTE